MIKILSIKVEDTLRKKFKDKVKQQNLSIKLVIMSAIYDYLKHDGNPSWIPNITDKIITTKEEENISITK